MEKESGEHYPRVVDEEQLPLTVWLNGDEPYFHDFCLDAEQVMEHLQIKRSRLRQVSGRELRVGRKKVDRYIRPVYRLDDVEMYREWTRSTATHQRSASMLESAAKDLAAKSDEIVSKVANDGGKLIQDLQQSSQQLYQPMNLQFEDIRLQLQKVFHRISLQQHELKGELASLLEKTFRSLAWKLEKLQQDTIFLSSIKQLLGDAVGQLHTHQLALSRLEQQASEQQTEIKNLKELQKLELVEIGKLKLSASKWSFRQRCMITKNLAKKRSRHVSASRPVLSNLNSWDKGVFYKKSLSPKPSIRKNSHRRG